jgi:4-alpha-glucanotransferase
MQDVLGLGSEARMNTPGTLGGNWTWRLLGDSLREADQCRLKLFTEIYDR